MSKTLFRLAVPAFALVLALPAFAESHSQAESGAQASEAAPADGATPPETPADPATVVARVNGTEITLGHMLIVREGLPPQYSSIPADVLFPGILDQLINQTLLEQSVKGAPSLRTRLSLENQSRSLVAAEAIRKIVEEKTTPAAVDEIYGELYGDAEPEEEFNAAHILVETEEEAKAIRAELDGGADFAALAKEKSTGPSGPNGGSLGWFGKGMMVAPFEEAVVALEPGQVSDPVQTQFGWHVIVLNEKRMKGAPPLEEVREEVEQVLAGRAVEAAIEALREGAEVDTSGSEGMDPGVLARPDILGEE